MENIIHKNAIELNADFMAGKHTAVEITQAFLNQIEKENKNINAFVDDLL